MGRGEEQVEAGHGALTWPRCFYHSFILSFLLLGLGRHYSEVGQNQPVFVSFDLMGLLRSHRAAHARSQLENLARLVALARSRLPYPKHPLAPANQENLVLLHQGCEARSSGRVRVGGCGKKGLTFEGWTCLSMRKPAGRFAVEQLVTPGISSYVKKSRTRDCVSWWYSDRAGSRSAAAARTFTGG